MDILVLGHKGMLGHMVTSYLRKHHNVTTVDSKFPEVHFLQFISNFKGDFIVNCIGAIPQKTNDFSINYDLPIWLDSNASCKIIHAGTDCEMDNDAYGISKRKASDFIKSSGTHTKILKSSIIGPELHSKSSLMEWFLNSEGTVKGYSEFFWNGNTTLEWAKQCELLMLKWNEYSIETILQGECISKCDLLEKIKFVFSKEIHILKDSSVKHNKCLIGNIRTPEIITQLIELKEYYGN